MSERRNANIFKSVLPLKALAGAGRTEVEIEVTARGRDLLLTIGGGDVHVGAVAVHSPGDGPEPFASLAVIPPHKEGPLAAMAADRLCRLTGVSCVAVAGIHQDGATRDEIESVVANVHSCLESIEKQLRPLSRGRGRAGGERDG